MKTPHRYFLPIDLESGQEITIEGTEYHHMVHVMRETLHSPLLLINGKGSLAKGHLIEMKKKEGRLVLEKVTYTPQKETLILAQALPKQANLEWILQKGTELGISHFFLFKGERSEAGTPSPQKWKRCDEILKGAIKQSERLYLPSIDLFPSLESLPLEKGSPIFFGDLREEAPPLLSLYETSEKKAPLFINGPEKGFSSKEIESMEKKGILGAKLSQGVLRTETAALTAAALLGYGTIK